MSRSNLKRLFTHHITIYRKNNTEDEYGGDSFEWEKKSWAIPCRIYGVKGPVYTITLNGTEMAIEKKMMCNRDVDIKEGDKIEQEKVNDVWLTVRVKPVYDKKKIHHLECLLSRIDTE